MNINPPREQLALLTDRTDSEYSYASVPSEFDLKAYWNVVVKRRRLLLLVVLVVFGLGGYFSLTATPMYKAASLLEIEAQNPMVTGVPGMVNTEGSNESFYATQFALMKSRRLAARVVGELKLDTNEKFTTPSEILTSRIDARITSLVTSNLQYLGFFISSLFAPSKNQDNPAEIIKGNRAETTAETSYLIQQPVDEKAYRWVGRYLNFLKVEPEKGTRLVGVVFTTPDPNLSQLLASAHARGFIAMTMETRHKIADEARAFLNGKNAELQKSLATSEDKLNRFRRTHGVVSMERGENTVVNHFVAVNQKLTEARTQRIDAEALKRTVENKPVQYLSQVMTQGMVPSLRNNLQALEAERVKLSATFKPDHPRMLDLSQQISEASRFLNAEIANVKKGIDQAYVAALDKEQALQAEADRQQQRALNLNEVGVEYAVLEEEVKVNRSLYQGILSRLHSTSVSNDLAFSNMQVIQWAERPNSPSSPNSVADLSLSAVLGLFLGMGLIFALEYLDSSVSTPGRVWRAVALSTFGVVPHLNSLKPLFDYNRFPGRLFIPNTPSRLLPHLNHPGELIVEHHPLSLLTESYRTIRTALLFSQAEQPPQVTLITSPSPGEGKTVTTLNLALALVQDGYKVLVIDADLRKGTCHTRLGLKNPGGLSDILTGNMALQNGIQETAVSGLSLIPRGFCPPNPSDLLGSRKMKEVLASLRESFNFILIDSPPAIAVSDARILSVNSDTVIVVFHAKKTTRDSARRLVELLDSVRAPIGGVILNGVNLKDPDYSYYRNYYSSDYVVSPDNTGGNRQPVIDAVIEPQFFERELGSIEFGSGTVSRQFFDKMIRKLVEAFGPMAPLIVAEHVISLGESLDNFPTSRLKELFERLSQEVLNSKLRQSFETAMIEEVRTLESKKFNNL